MTDPTSPDQPHTPTSNPCSPMEGVQPPPATPENPTLRDVEVPSVPRLADDTPGPAVREDSGLTPDEHQARFGSLQPLPPDHPDRLINQEAFKRGIYDHDLQKSHEANPYSPVSPQFRYWNRGWADAERRQPPAHPVRETIKYLIRGIKDDERYSAAVQYLREALAVCPAAEPVPAPSNRDEADRVSGTDTPDPEAGNEPRPA